MRRRMRSRIFSGMRRRMWSRMRSRRGRIGS